MKKKFHISCCGRSGSKYVAAALKNMGFSVLHEMGDDWPFPQGNGIKYIAQNSDIFQNYDGIIGWKWSLLTPRYAESFDLQFHMVRNPISAIESATTHADSLFSTVERHLGMPEFLSGVESEETIRLGRAINYWLRYNEAFGKGKPILKVEDFSNAGATFMTFSEMVGGAQKAGELLGFLPKDINARKQAKRRVSLTWKKLGQKFPVQADQVRLLAESYGYSVE
ncbi:hypothetical protein [Microbulbifer aggregans]|uniref:hypothetical protein n=1 Tax=Microbulbifer aggregans TaxID=1769779 RepID=UPI001CFD18E4|nr:hypothetical protein [Microbulbifer aggregans]